MKAVDFVYSSGDTTSGFTQGELAGCLPYRHGKVRVGVCSNLAAPYGVALKRLFPTLDAYAMSYEIGALKPDPVMYRSACKLLGVTIGDRFGNDRVAMVGDSLRCDCHGPRAVGINGLHLDRSGAGRVTNLGDFASLILAD